MKRCTKCGEVKSLGEFGKLKRAKDGLNYWCKPCNRNNASGWYAGNRDRAAVLSASWRASNRDRKAETDARYQSRNREKIRSYSAEWRKNNPEWMRNWRAENPDKRATYDHKRRAHKADAPHEPYSRSEIFATYGGTCAYCDAPAGHLDHVNPISKGGADAPRNLLPACAPCNLSKGAKTLAQWAETF